MILKNDDGFCDIRSMIFKNDDGYCDIKKNKEKLFYILKVTEILTILLKKSP